MKLTIYKGEILEDKVSICGSVPKKEAPYEKYLVFNPNGSASFTDFDESLLCTYSKFFFTPESVNAYCERQIF